MFVQFVKYVIQQHKDKYQKRKPETHVTKKPQQNCIDQAKDKTSWKYEAVIWA